MSQPAAATPPQATSPTEAWKKLASLALEAAAKRPVEFSASDRGAFVGRLQETLGGLDDHTEPSKILIASGSLAEGIEQYNGLTQRNFDGLVEQFRSLTRMLAEHGHNWPDAVRQNIEAALDLKDLPALKEKLAQCLETAKTAAWAAPSKSELATPALASSVSEPLATALADPCTGLPLRNEAETNIRHAMSGVEPAYVAAFYIHRMNLINARFGEAIGNQVILFCSQHIATHLSGANDNLFRWRGPGFVAVIQRNESPMAIASEVQRFTAMPLSRFFETPSRTVYLPIKLTGEVFPTAGKTFEELIEQVQTSLHSLGAED